MPEKSYAYESSWNDGLNLKGVGHFQTLGDKKGEYESALDNYLYFSAYPYNNKRMETLILSLKNTTGYSGSIEYRVHQQTYGWTGWVSNGKRAGVTGQSKRIEAIQVRLTGELAKHYNVLYRVKVEKENTPHDWSYNGAISGTTGEARRIDTFEIKIIKKDTTKETTSVMYKGHLQSKGWTQGWMSSHNTLGNANSGKRLEAFELELTDAQYTGSIEYSAHVQKIGWQNYVSDGAIAGTTGKAKRIEALQVKLVPKTLSSSYKYEVSVLNNHKLYTGQPVIVYIKTNNPDVSSLTLNLSNGGGGTINKYDQDILFKSSTVVNGFKTVKSGSGYVATISFANPENASIKITEKILGKDVVVATKSVNILDYYVYEEKFYADTLNKVVKNSMSDYEKMNALCTILKKISHTKQMMVKIIYILQQMQVLGMK